MIDSTAVTIDKATALSLKELAKQTLKDNDLGGYTVPTHGLYPFQWNWDSAITALGWMKFDEPRAWQEIEILFSGQWDNGMVPHILFHKNSETYFPGPNIWGANRAIKSTSISQPPVLATAIKEMLETAKDSALATEKVTQLFNKLVEYHLWWYNDRDPQNTGLVVTYHPWESGMDNSPAWDEALHAVPCVDWEYTRRDTSHVDPSQRPHKSEYDRFLYLVDFFKRHNFDSQYIFDNCPYKMNDLGIIAILHRATKDLLILGDKLGLNDARTEYLAKRAKMTEQAIGSLWCESSNYFYCRNVLTNSLAKVKTSAGLLCVYAGLATKAQTESLNNTAQQWIEASQFSIASTHPSETCYEPQRYWRGPIWLHINWMIALGFAESGFANTANHIQQDTRNLVLTSGYYEYFNPETGAGCGGKNFSWTAAIALHWLLD